MPVILLMERLLARDCVVRRREDVRTNIVVEEDSFDGKWTTIDGYNNILCEPNKKGDAKESLWIEILAILSRSLCVVCSTPSPSIIHVRLREQVMMNVRTNKAIKGSGCFIHSQLATVQRLVTWLKGKEEREKRNARFLSRIKMLHQCLFF
jgi:hypothetical protein